jgi:cation diffusion facilitator CzcD-associated flavoprotein CzcO
LIIIVGGGPAGLALAYYLQQNHVPYRVLERAEIGHAWNNHYDRLHLHTLKQVSALPGLAMPADYPPFPSARQFQAYLAGYARHFDLQVETGVEVLSARHNHTGWLIHTNRGVEQARFLVAATGIWSRPYLPLLPGQEMFPGSIIHASDYRNAATYRGRRVLVVGAGNSGSEIAVDLSEHGVETAIAIRSGLVFVPYPRSAAVMDGLAWLFRTLPRPAGDQLLRRARRDFSHLGVALPDGKLIDAYPVVGYALPRALAAGRVQRFSELVQLLGDQAVFVDGRQHIVDDIILATGYRPALDFVTGELDFAAQGHPRLDAAGRSLRQPRLYCVGYDYPATEGWLQALGRVTRRAAAMIAADYRRAGRALPAATPLQEHSSHRPATTQGAGDHA